MTVRKESALILGAVLTLVAASGAVRGDSPAVRPAAALGPGSELWLEGTSTMHDFVCRTSDLGFTLEIDSTASPPTDAQALHAVIRSAGVRSVTVDVPVASLRSEKDGLDKNLRKTMRAEEHPNVRFRLAGYDVVGDGSSDTITIRSRGALTIVGRERPVTLEARAIRSGSGVWLEGSRGLRMTDYGIKPPTMMLGTLRVGDSITVRYRLLLVPREGGSTGSSQ